MQFSDSKPIYLQICDFICEKIVSRTWKEEDKIPSVRDMSMELEINSNTVVRAYEQLTAWEVIYTKRGLGYFVNNKGYQAAKKRLKQEFMEEMLPNFFQRIQILEIEIEEIENKYKTYLNKQKK